ncbi:MAG TPA: NlpC/P60 family protein [Rubricoccaceae bacterium]|nr:NlpC/P60 family protein [Rubricoccaceae bacterium]
MTPSRYPPPHRLVLLLVGAALLSGCGALNPLKDVEPGPDSAWSRPAARPAHTAPAASRPAPATSPARTTRRTREAAEADAAASGSVSAEAPVLAGTTALSLYLREEGDDWLGTPYRYGGESAAGIDCSAFVRALMREALGIELTRATHTQVEEGVPVDKEDLLPGDLVFFRRRGTRHVGVYLGGGEFIHASSSNGVIVSRLDEGYYERHYWTARRVVDDPRRFLLPDAFANRATPDRQPGGSPW